MSGPERCVNPDCTEYGMMQLGPCTLWPQQRTREDYKALENRYFGNQTGDVQNGRTVKMCLTCGALAANTLGHAVWHESLERTVTGE